MKRKPLTSHPVRGREDVRAFFDDVARDYRESHGDAAQLFRYRLRLLHALLPQEQGGVLVEIGCGPGQHLLALAARFDRAVGLDLSPVMIEQAERLRRQHPLRERIVFAVDPAEELATLEPDSVDALICIGAFEHMLQPDRVLRQIRRVLKVDERFVCLTPNGGYVWYTHLARRLGCEVRHLTTDRFVTERRFRALLAASGLEVEHAGYWTFIPRGDMPRAVATVLDVLDAFGRIFGVPALRGGLYLVAKKAGQR